ncbi:MAG TPA: hypothetical protein VGL57_10430, partial [Solirubrobacteraceae bacterium]
MSVLTPAVGAPVARLEGRLKVTGEARYAYEHELERISYGWIVQSEVARGRIDAVEVRDALEVPGAVGVFWHANAPAVQPVSNAELAVLQSSEVAYRGQIVGCVVAETLEAA